MGASLCDLSLLSGETAIAGMAAVPFFLDAYESAKGFKVKSWDDAFDRLHPKGTHVDKEKRHFELRYVITQRVEKLRSEKKPVDNELFDEIGKELGIGGHTTVSKIYYEEHGRLKEITDRFNEIRDQVLGTSEKK